VRELGRGYLNPALNPLRHRARLPHMPSG
jgi:hypothetical protein